ncbi:phosphatase PAP2 family protein [uncultured Pelagimonas sp.]|uniref:phosphatase PAP2 family protein n=1 Tax=uncultured Pelagimonas sp. TaxID=1618102 RepID=UPI00260F8D88|nr:phosphatase PAP2 family protein [uncultured Pelagimonas sp.]
MSTEDYGAPSAAFAAFAAFGNSAAFAAFGGQAAFGMPENPVLAEALLRSRDGVVGNPLHIHDKVPALHENDVANLTLLSPDVRSSLWLSELGSRVAITAPKHKDGVKASLWKLAMMEEDIPRVETREVISMTRPSEQTFREQMKWVAGYADIRTDRAAEILSQVASPVPFYATISFLDPARTPFTLELLQAGLRFANFVEMQMKYILAVKRPIEYSPQVQPMIPTPNHGALPSGHATEAFLTARLLWKLLRASGQSPYSDNGYWGEMLMRTASRIAVNRTVAGVHFPVDSAAGSLLGLTLADLISSECQGNTEWTASKFIGTEFDWNSDFNWHALYDAEHDKQKRRSVWNSDDTQDEGLDEEDDVWAKEKEHVWAKTRIQRLEGPCITSKPLNWLWTKALAEWRDPNNGTKG